MRIILNTYVLEVFTLIFVLVKGDSTIYDITFKDYVSSDNLVTLNIGEPSQGNLILISTKDNTNWLYSSSCKDCKGSRIKFDETKSSSYERLSEEKSLIDITSYSQLKGYLSKDYFSLNKQLKSYADFVLVNEVSKVQTLYNGSFSIGFPGDYFISLKNQGLISNAMVGLSLLDFRSGYSFTGIQDASKLSIGGYSESIVKKKEKIIWTTIRSEETFSEYSALPFILQNKSKPASPWFFKAKFQVGDDTSTLKEFKVIFDINQMGVSIPKQDLINMKRSLFISATNQVNYIGYYDSNCSNYEKEFKNFNLILDSNESLVIKPYDYVEFDPIDERCRIYIKMNYQNNFLILGRLFFQRYYIIFDYSSQKVGFYDLNISEDQIGGSKLLFFIIFTVVGGVVFFAMVFFIYKKCIRSDDNNAVNGN